MDYDKANKRYHRSQERLQTRLMLAAAHILAGYRAAENYSDPKMMCRLAMEQALELEYLAAQWVEDDVVPENSDSTYDKEEE